MCFLTQSRGFAVECLLSPSASAAPADMTRALGEARNATTARAREAEVLKQELAQLRAGSSAAAEPTAPEEGGGLLQRLAETAFLCVCPCPPGPRYSLRLSIP